MISVTCYRCSLIASYYSTTNQWNNGNTAMAFISYLNAKWETLFQFNCVKYTCAYCTLPLLNLKRLFHSSLFCKSREQAYVWKSLPHSMFTVLYSDMTVTSSSLWVYICWVMYRLCTWTLATYLSCNNWHFCTTRWQH
jgi:hypothetical protein